MSWKDRRKGGNASGLITLNWEAIDRAVAELRDWKPKYIDAPVRYSSEKQAEGTSEARQVGNIEVFIKRLWSDLIPRWLKDLATSGYKYSAKTGLPHCLDEDKALGRYIAQAKRGEIPADTIVIVDNFDRFSRAEIDDSFEAAMTLLRNGITMLFLHPKPLLMRPEDRNNAEKRDILSGELNRAHGESATRSRYIKGSVVLRIAAAMAGEQINFGGLAPNYYRWDEEKEMYVPDETFFPIVQRAAIAVSENKVLFQIVRDLNDEHAPRLRNGNSWLPSTLYKLLHSESLLGTLTINGQKIPNYFNPPVVTEEQWGLIQARISSDQPAGGGTKADADIRNLFPCRVYCVHCRMPMVSVGGSSFEGRSYICRGHRGHVTETEHICDQPRRVLGKAMELDFFGRIITKLPTEFIERPDASRRKEQAELQVEIAKLEKQLRKAEGHHTDNDDETRDAELKARVEEYKSQIKPKRKCLGDLASELRAEVGSEKAMADIVKRLVGDEAGALKSMDEVVILLQKQLADQALRRSLIGPLKMMVARIDVDVRTSTRNSVDEDSERMARYRVQLVGGALIEWSDVTILCQDLIKANFAASMTEDRKQRQKASLIANGKANPLTPAQKKRHIDAVIKFANTPGERAARSVRNKAYQARVAKGLAQLLPEPPPPLLHGIDVKRQRMNHYWERVRMGLAILKQQEEQNTS